MYENLTFWIRNGSQTHFEVNVWKLKFHFSVELYKSRFEFYKIKLLVLNKSKSLNICVKSKHIKMMSLPKEIEIRRHIGLKISGFQNVCMFIWLKLYKSKVNSLSNVNVIIRKIV